MKVGIIDYQIGNLKSVYNAIKVAGGEPLLIEDKNDFNKVNSIVIPGVGNFKKGIENLKKIEFIDILNEKVINEGIPCLGICLGMQLMSCISEEGGVNGLGWFNSKVIKISTISKEYRVPHMGWNDIKIVNKSKLFKGLENPTFYFVHSYHLIFKNNDDYKMYVTSITWNGCEIISSIEKDNIFGVQFHPEKSQLDGIYLLKNFISLMKND